MSTIYPLRAKTLARQWKSLLVTSILFPLCGIAAPPKQTFLPPQRVSVTSNVLKMVVADINGDAFDDIVALTTDGIDVYINDGKTRAPGEDVTFTKMHIALTTHENREAAEAKIKFSSGGDLQVVDLDNDGKPDLLASWAGTGEIFVLWNQGANAPAPFVFVPDGELATDPSMTILSPLAQRAGDEVLGTPIFVTAANLGEGSGRKSIVAYHGSLQQDSSSTQPPPFNQRNYESLGIIYPTKGTARGFDSFTQRTAWPGCDLAFGGASSGCVGWNDSMPANASLYNFRIAAGARLDFDDAASDVITMDSGGSTSAYVPAVLRPNASPGLQVANGRGANGSDAIWLEGGAQINEFVHDNGLKLMRRRTALPTIEGNERSGGSTLTMLSTGQPALITAGGMDVYYDPSNPASVVKQPIPDYVNRTGEVGALLAWTKLDAGSALISLSDYCRAPDPCVGSTSWYHVPLDGSSAPALTWGGSHSLVMLDYAKEMTSPSGTQFEPFFQNFDDGRFQAFSVTSAAQHKPMVASGNFASPSEHAIVVLDHQDGSADDPLLTHLALYRPDTAGTYVSPQPHLDGLTVGRFIQNGLTDIGNTLPKGETSGVLVGAQLGVGIADAIRYVLVRDKATNGVVGIFSGDPAEKVAGIATDGVVVPGLSTLDIGTYVLEAHNANASASMDLKIVNPFGITATNYDWSAGGECGILPNTKDGNLWPNQIAVSVTAFPGADSLQAVRWIKTDGTVVDLPASGYASYDDASGTVTLILPQDGSLTDGRWHPFIKAAGVWQEVPHSWNVAHDSATIGQCANQVSFVNEEAYAQCTNDDYYLDAAQYAVWPHLVNGSFRFFGSGFAHVQSAALKQGDKRFFSTSLQVVSDNEIHVNFSDLGDVLTPDVVIALNFYGESGDVVASNGVAAVGGRTSWRTARARTCVPQLPQITDILNAGSGTDGTFLSGDTIKVSGKNLLYPVPTATKLVLKGDDDSLYVLENPRLPDDWLTQPYSNDNLVLYFTVPDDVTTAKISDGKSSGTTELGAGLVVAGSGALATTAVSEGGLAALLSNPVTAIATLGATATGLSIYAGVENSIWLYQKVTMSLAKTTPSPTDLTKPGQSADDQAKDPSHLIFFTYELAKPADLRDRFVYASTILLPSYQIADAERQVRSMIAFIEDLSSLQISIFGETYWSYSNATITSITDLGPEGTTPSSMQVSYYVCLSDGWDMSPLDNVHTEIADGDVLSWKTNAYFGWDPPRPLTSADFLCFPDRKTISLVNSQLTAY